MITGKKPAHSAVLVILVITLLAYGNSLRNSFVWDDYSVIADNDFIKSWKNLPLVFNKVYLVSREDIRSPGARSLSSEETTYRPVVTISYFIDYQVWKTNPFGYHLTNMVLHIFNALIFYYLIILITGNINIALLSALLFALHPVNTEAVDVITFREDLLAFLFSVTSFIAYIKLYNYNGVKKIAAYVFSLAMFLLAVFSKEMAVTLPLMLITYDYYFVFNGQMSAIYANLKSRYSGYMLASFFYLWVWGLLMGNNNLPVEYPGGSFFTNCLTMITVVAAYIKWIFLPQGIHPVLGVQSLISHVLSWKVCASVLTVGFFLILAVKVYKRSKIASFALLWFFISLIPVYNIIPLGNIMAARYLYIPMAGFCLFAAAILFNAPGLTFKDGQRKLLKRVRYFLIALSLLFCCRATFMLNRDWRDNCTFWSKMERIYPDIALPHYNLGNDYADKEMHDKAIEEYKAAIRLAPDYPNAHLNLGSSYRDKGMFEEAVDEYKRALILQPGLTPAFVNLGNVFADKKLYDTAISYFKKAIAIDRRYMPAYEGLGVVYARMHDFKEAREVWLEALKINPGYNKIQDNLRTLTQLGY